MLSNKLKLNNEKTEAMLVGSCQAINLTDAESIQIGGKNFLLNCHAHMFTHMHHPFMLGCSTQVGRLYNPNRYLFIFFTKKRKKRSNNYHSIHTQFNSHTTGCNASRRTPKRPTTYTQAFEHVPRRRLTVSPHDWL